MPQAVENSSNNETALKRHITDFTARNALIIIHRASQLFSRIGAVFLARKKVSY